jgi:hypothetical protein
MPFAIVRNEFFSTGGDVWPGRSAHDSTAERLRVYSCLRKSASYIVWAGR